MSGHRMPGLLGLILIGTILGLGSACQDTTPRDEDATAPAETEPGGDAPAAEAQPSVDPELLASLPEPPSPDLNGMEPQVVRLLTLRRDKVVADPASAAAWGRFGIACDAHDLFPPAVECYRVAHRLQPDALRWKYFLARALEIVGGDMEEVLSLYGEVLQMSPLFAPGHVRHGEALLRAGRPTDALAAFDQAVAIDERTSKAHRGRGQALLLADDIEGSVAALTRATELEPDDGGAWGFLARALLRSGDRAGARAAQAKARELPTVHVAGDAVLAEIGLTAMSADACLRRASARLRDGNPQAAIPDLEVALSVRPDDTLARTRLAGAYAAVGRTGDALGAFERVLELDPESGSAHRNYGELLVRAGRFSDAVEHLRRAEARLGADATSVAMLAAALAQAGDITAALSEFERAAGLGELTARDHNNWGTALAASGREAEAVASFTEAIRLDNRMASAHFNLAVALSGTNRGREADFHLRKAAELDPRGPAARWLAAQRPAASSDSSSQR